MTAPPVRSSVEKLDEQLQRLTAARGEDAAQKMLLNTMRACMPALRKMGYIPDDPVELDVVLLAGARWMLLMRSDDAPIPDTVADLVELYPRPDNASEGP